MFVVFSCVPGGDDDDDDDDDDDQGDDGDYSKIEGRRITIVYCLFDYHKYD